MSKRPIHSYVFNPGAATLDLSGIAGFDIRNLFAVIHLPTGSVIYAPKPGLGFSTVLNGVLRLQAAVGAMSASDPLLVIYDDGGKPAEDTSVQAIVTALATPAQDGMDATGVTAPAGGTGIRGWLSGIYAALKGTVKVDGSAVTQPISAATLPLPAGAATAANQATANAALDSISGALGPLSAQAAALQVSNLIATGII